MKKLLTIVLCAAVALLVGCVTNDVVVDFDQLKGGTLIRYFEGKPFTGVGVS